MVDSDPITFHISHFPAATYPPEPPEVIMKFEMLDTDTRGTVIKVVGVGGAGGNAVAHMIRRGVQGVDFICANTDMQALSHTNAPV